MKCVIPNLKVCLPERVRTPQVISWPFIIYFIFFLKKERCGAGDVKPVALSEKLPRTNCDRCKASKVKRYPELFSKIQALRPWSLTYKQRKYAASTSDLLIGLLDTLGSTTGRGGNTNSRTVSEMPSDKDEHVTEQLRTKETIQANKKSIRGPQSVFTRRIHNVWFTLESHQVWQSLNLSPESCRPEDNKLVL